MLQGPICEADSHTATQEIPYFVQSEYKLLYYETPTTGHNPEPTESSLQASAQKHSICHLL
jgi:hypothetical protein